MPPFTYIETCDYTNSTLDSLSRWRWQSLWIYSSVLESDALKSPWLLIISRRIPQIYPLTPHLPPQHKSHTGGLNLNHSYHLPAALNLNVSEFQSASQLPSFGRFAFSRPPLLRACPRLNVKRWQERARYADGEAAWSLDMIKMLSAGALRIAI
ncbi:uncharacterized protein BDW70DRAFT_80727 [Aspergillus foveolatus]|uniref:uncharacterized protein n=1 Tax=Aspergillus foveolatus TaxID=210207 RepID=UPI003CCDC60D